MRNPLLHTMNLMKSSKPAANRVGQAAGILAALLLAGCAEMGQAFIDGLEEGLEQGLDRASSCEAQCERDFVACVNFGDRRGYPPSTVTNRCQVLFEACASRCESQ